MVFSATLSGVLFGFSLSILAGPIFFAIIQLSLERGMRQSIVLAAGQWFSDFMFIVLSFYFAEKLELLGRYGSWLGISGGIFLIIFGATMVFGPDRNKNGTGEMHIKDRYPLYFMRGFFINTLNPGPVLFWAGVTANGVSQQYTNSMFLGMYSGVLGTVILTDTLKSYLARSIRKLINPKLLHRLRQLSGAIILIFGIVLLVRSLTATH